MNDFGARLAPMTVRKPSVVPADPADLSAPRWSVRSKGEQAFLFYNGHVRQYALPAQKQVQFAVKLPGRAVTLPNRPVDIAAGSYFFWPLNFDLDGYRLRYATAQPVARLERGKAGSVYVFAAQDGIAPEFALDGAARGCVKAAGAQARLADTAAGILVEGIQPGLDAAMTLDCAGRKPVTVLVLSQQQARRLAIGRVQGERRLVISEHQAYFADGRLVLRSAGKPAFRAAVFPALALPLAQPGPGGAAARANGKDGMFQLVEATLPAQELAVSARQVRAAQPVPPIKIGGNAKAAVQPDPEAFGNAAAWELSLGATRPKGVDGALLEIDFAGDVARLFDGTRMVDDWYYNGQQWQFGLDNLPPRARTALTLTVLPLRADAPIYLPKEHRPAFDGQAQLAELRKVKLTPVYRIEIGR
jgi:hypothetical protein